MSNHKCGTCGHDEVHHHDGRGIWAKGCNQPIAMEVGCPCTAFTPAHQPRCENCGTEKPPPPPGPEEPPEIGGWYCTKCRHLQPPRGIGWSLPPRAPAHQPPDEKLEHGVWCRTGVVLCDECEADYKRAHQPPTDEPIKLPVRYDEYMNYFFDGGGKIVPSIGGERDFCKHAALCINDHQHLLDENAELREALEKIKGFTDVTEALSKLSTTGEKRDA